MTDETITLEFLAGRIERVLEEIAQMRGDLFVMTGMIHRLDGTVKVLANEVIEHAWLEPQVRKLGEQARIVRLLVERVNLATDGMQVRLRAKGLQTLVEELRLRAAA